MRGPAGRSIIFACLVALVAPGCGFVQDDALDAPPQLAGETTTTTARPRRAGPDTTTGPSRPDPADPTPGDPDPGDPDPDRPPPSDLDPSELDLGSLNDLEREIVLHSGYDPGFLVVDPGPDLCDSTAQVMRAGMNMFATSPFRPSDVAGDLQRYRHSLSFLEDPMAERFGSRQLGALASFRRFLDSIDPAQGREEVSRLVYEHISAEGSPVGGMLDQLAEACPEDLPIPQSSVRLIQRDFWGGD